MTTVREIMTDNPCIVGTDATSTDIADTLASNDVGAVVVCNADRRTTRGQETGAEFQEDQPGDERSDAAGGSRVEGSSHLGEGRPE